MRQGALLVETRGVSLFRDPHLHTSLDGGLFLPAPLGPVVPPISHLGHANGPIFTIPAPLAQRRDCRHRE